MPEPFPRISHNRKTGAEPFECDGELLGFDLLSFWQWSTSDVISNVTRGRLAEYLVARAMGVGVEDIREEWAAYDVKSPEGIKIEVKSAAYVQSWAQKGPSTIQFGYKKTRSWDAETNVLTVDAQRPADLYVLALLFHSDQETLNPLDVAQWRFYVVPTSVLNARVRSQHSITLRSLEAIVEPVSFVELRAKVLEACAVELVSRTL
jgi:hypothetical protein